MRTVIAAALLAAAPCLAFADETTGTIASVDMARKTIILTDKTVWMLPDTGLLRQPVAADDKLRIVYVSYADNGWMTIARIERIPGQGGAFRMHARCCGFEQAGLFRPGCFVPAAPYGCCVDKSRPMTTMI
jgi:hypothetical protein